MNSKNKRRLTYIEPNEYAGLFAKRNDSNINNKNELSWNPEDLVMSADLQVIIPRREDAGQVSYMVHVDGNALKVDDGLYGRYVSYMGGVPYDDSKDSQSFLTDNYTNISYQEVANNTVVDKESLGINSIDINFDAHFFPMVTINFTDVRGAALFMLSEEEYQSSLSGDKQFDSASSFFKALFHFPYPRFLLSVKGFYGTKVTFQLAVSNFRSGFKPETGDYDITVQFIGYIYGLYTDLPFDLVMAAPYYNTIYWEQQKARGVFKYVNSDGSPGNDINTYVQFLGKMESKDLDSDVLEGADIVKSYARVTKAIEALKVIPELYKAACECPVFIDGTTKRYDKATSTSGSYTFVWGSVSAPKDAEVSGNGGFSFQEKNTLELYKAIQNIYRNFPEYIGVVEEGNIFLSSFYTKEVDGKKMKSSDITNDNEFKNNKLFSYVGNTKKLTEYFTFYKKDEPIIENGTPSPSLKANGYYTISNNDKFRKAINENDNFRDRPLFGVNSDLAEDLPYMNNDEGTSHVNKNRCLLINVSEYCNGIEEIIKNLSEELTNIQGTVAEELKIAYRNIIGFEPTVENYYRMLFAHLDCFFDYYTNKVLHQVKKDYDEHKRTLDKMGISAKETDLPKRFSRVAPNTVSLYPYPAYYTEFGSRRKIKIADYPGYAVDKGISRIPEVDAVKKILEGLDDLQVDYERNVASKYTVDAKKIFSPLSILYDFRNPWADIKLTKTNTEQDVLHIIYYYLCLLYVDRTIGTNTGKRSKEENDGKIAYYEQMAYLLFDVIGNELDDNFTNKLKYITNTIKQSDGIDYVLNGLKNMFGKTEVNSKQRMQCLYTPYKWNGKLKFIEDYIAFKISDDILSTPIDALVPPSFYKPDGGDYCDPKKNPHYIVSGDDTYCRQRIRAFGDMWFLKDINDNVLKGYNKLLMDNGDGYEYLYKDKEENLLDGVKKKAKGAPGSVTYGGYINLGDYNTNILLKKPYSLTKINPFVGFNTRCDILFSTQNVDYSSTDSDGYHSGSYTGANEFVKLVDTGGYTYRLLRNFYDGESIDDYYINFIGRKEPGFLDSEERVPSIDSDGRGFYVIPKYDKHTSVNLFSGVKRVVVNGEVLVEYNENVPVEDMHWEFKEGFNKEQEEDYKGLLYTRRCLGLVEVTSGNTKWNELPRWYSMSDEEKQKARYAFAAYFLATLSGHGRLKEIVDSCMYNMTDKHTCVVRKVDLLYLGASLYFAQNEYNAWSHGINKNIRDLINEDGTLAYGLVKEDLGVNNNPDIEVQTLLYESGDKIIEYFENWCNNELFGGTNMYDKLSVVAEEDENWEYVTFNGYAAYNETKNKNKYSHVQGYSKGSTCENWLTNLVYDYEYLVTFYCKKSIAEDVAFSRDDITNFLDTLYNSFESKRKKDEERKKKIEEGDTNILSQDQKRATYYLLKNLYDKWLCTYTANEFKLGTPQEDLEIRKKRFSRSEVVNEYSEYNNFIYIDQFYRDISSTYIMDSDAIAEVIKTVYTGTRKMDIYTFMSFMAQKNNLMLMALPVYSNMYSPENVERIFTPNTFYNMNDVKNPNGVGTTYVVMYTSEVSHKPGDFGEYDYDSDFPNGDLSGGEGPVDLDIFSNTGNQSASDLDYNVTAFGVTYSKQNQMYFKKIDVNMDNPKVTNESIQNTLMLADGGSGGDTSQPIAIGNNIYSIYSNRSYTCTVEMLGCMNIMPLMYFQLNNIPMFRGLYLIISVKHSIRAGNITTVFTGVRVSKYSLPDVTDIMINSNIFKKVLQSDAWRDGKDISGGSVGSGKRLEVATALGFNSHPTEKECKARMKTIELTSYPGMSITVHEDLAEQVQNIFKELSELNVQLSSIGGYCYRKINNPNQPNSNILSLHSLGCAIDINPALNPFVKNSKPMSTGDDTSIGKIRTLNSPIVAVFKKYGWGWGGTYGDYMHFSKADGK